MENDLYFKLSPNCFVVKSGKKPSLCDIEQQSYRYIPDDLSYILTELRGCTVGEVMQFFGEKRKDRIAHYFQFLLQSRVGYFSHHPTS